MLQVPHAEARVPRRADDGRRAAALGRASWRLAVPRMPVERVCLKVALLQVQHGQAGRARRSRSRRRILPRAERRRRAAHGRHSPRGRWHRRIHLSAGGRRQHRRRRRLRRRRHRVQAGRRQAQEARRRRSSRLSRAYPPRGGPVCPEAGLSAPLFRGGPIRPSVPRRACPSRRGLICPEVGRSVPTRAFRPLCRTRRSRSTEGTSLVRTHTPLQGYLAHKKLAPHRTLQ